MKKQGLAKVNPQEFSAWIGAGIVASALLLPDFPALASPVPAVNAALGPDNIQEAYVDALIADLPTPSIDKIWVKVRQPISVDELSDDDLSGCVRIISLGSAGRAWW